MAIVTRMLASRRLELNQSRRTPSAEQEEKDRVGSEERTD